MKGEAVIIVVLLLNTLFVINSNAQQTVDKELSKTIEKASKKVALKIYDQIENVDFRNILIIPFGPDQQSDITTHHVYMAIATQLGNMFSDHNIKSATFENLFINIGKKVDSITTRYAFDNTPLLEKLNPDLIVYGEYKIFDDEVVIKNVFIVKNPFREITNIPWNTRSIENTSVTYNSHFKYYVESFFIPGLGQYNQNRRNWGVPFGIWCGSVATGLVSGYIAKNKKELYKDEYILNGYSNKYYTEKDNFSTALNVCYGAAAIIALNMLTNNLWLSNGKTKKSNSYAFNNDIYFFPSYQNNQLVIGLTIKF